LALPSPGFNQATSQSPSSPSIDSPATDPQPLFGSALEPALREACDQRLSGVSWFRTDWQRGGALTGYARYTPQNGQTASLEVDVVVKLPVPPRERRWLIHLQAYDHVAPRLFAHGETLGEYDMAWVVMERMAYGPLGANWKGKEFDLLVEAAGRFYLAASEMPLQGQPQQLDWEKLFHRSRKIVREHNLPHEQRWNRALKQAQRKLKDWITRWKNRPVDHWCHGDLHLGNAMTRTAPDTGPAVLLDYAETRPGCWVEDAVYFEHLFWARRQRLGDRKLCKMIARQRKQLGLPVDSDWAWLAAVKRALLAMSTPARLAFDGDPHHVEAALKVLEASV